MKLKHVAYAAGVFTRLFPFLAAAYFAGTDNLCWTIFWIVFWMRQDSEYYTERRIKNTILSILSVFNGLKDRAAQETNINNRSIPKKEEN